MRVRWAAVVPGVVLTACGACGPISGGEAGNWNGEVRDSAGIEIVTNRGPGTWSPGEAWSVTTDLVIRSEEGRPETLFGRVEDVAVDAGGRIYVLDAVASTVRVFDAEGETVRSIGRPGEGPGELGGFANGVMLRGDTLLVPDWGQSRINRFLRDGTVLESFRVPGPGGRTWWTATRDGRLLARRLERFRDEENRWGGRDLLVELLGEGSRLDTLLVFEYAQSDLGTPDDPRVPLLVNAPTWAPLEDGRIAWTSLDRTRVRIEDPDEGVVRLFGHDEWVLRLVTDAERRALVELLGVRFGMLGADPGLVEGLTYLDEETVPAVTGVRSGPEGTVWVQRMGEVGAVRPFALNSPDHPEWLGGARWDVFDREGRYLGPVELPDRFEMMRIVGDHVYGTRRDALDAEEVVRLRLER